MNKDDSFFPWKYNVRTSWKVAPVKTEAKPESVGSPANDQLRLGILARDATHHAGADFGGDLVHVRAMPLASGANLRSI